MPLRPFRPSAALLALLVAPLLGGAGATAWGQSSPSAPPPTPPPEWRLMEGLYQEGDLFRTESEVLRWQATHADPAAWAEVQLLRAKLYYRAGRDADAELMLYALLDRVRGGAAAGEALRLLAYSQLRQGRTAEAARLWEQVQGAPVDPAALQPPPDMLPDGEAALAWSTWLPGSGFFVLGQPGKGAAALSVNLVLIGAAALAWQQDNPGAALIFALAEASFWAGGRQAVLEEAARQRQAVERDWRADWLQRNGEPALLRIGLRWRFGGP